MSILRRALRAARSGGEGRALATVAPALLALFALAALVIAGGASPARRSPVTRTAGPHTKVLFIGIDAADWNVITPLVEAGRMPHLAALLQHAASGPLLTIQPLTKS